VAGISAGIGWVGVIVGGIVAIVSLPSIQQFGIIGVTGGILIAAVGLLQVGVAQGVRAAVDTADYAAQSLRIQIAQAEGLAELDLRSVRRGSSAPADAPTQAAFLTRAPGVGSVTEGGFVALDPSLAREYIEAMRSQERSQEADALLRAWYRVHRTKLHGIKDHPPV
jgi:hypothetical protein